MKLEGGQLEVNLAGETLLLATKILLADQKLEPLGELLRQTIDWKLFQSFLKFVVELDDVDHDSHFIHLCIGQIFQKSKSHLIVKCL